MKIRTAIIAALLLNGCSGCYPLPDEQEEAAARARLVQRLEAEAERRQAEQREFLASPLPAGLAEGSGYKTFGEFLDGSQKASTEEYEYWRVWGYKGDPYHNAEGGYVPECEDLPGLVGDDC